MLIVKRFTFEAAHQLPNHDGKCRDLHGHTYTVDVGVRGDVRPADGSPQEGMVIDFGIVSAAFRENVYARCDHKFLNDVLPVPVTTAEHIAGWILDEMTRAVALRDETVEVAFVRVWETQTGYAEAAR